MKASAVPEISVVVLCYGLGGYSRIFSKRIIEVLDTRGLDYEIILVGNYIPGKDEVTPKVVEEIAACNPRIRAVAKEITRPGEGGMGWNMRSGLEAARGKTIAVIDGDGQMPAEDIIKVYDKLVREQIDLVKARRISRGDSDYRKFISGIYNFLMRLIFPGITPSDINGKPKILSREAYNKLNLESVDWFIDAEIMIKARRLRFRVGEIDTTFHKKTAPETDEWRVKAIFEFLKNIVRWRLKEFGASRKS